MPEIFRYRGFKFFFYSNEGTPREPVHVHVEKDDIEAKFWVVPEVSVHTMMVMMRGRCVSCSVSLKTTQTLS
jgi:hypothetical protein